MPGSPASRRSLYPLLAGIIAGVVLTVLGVHAAIEYADERGRIVVALESGARAALDTLQKNAAPLMAAYAVNEYEQLAATEMDLADIEAIIIDDFNMGKLLGTQAHTTGWVRTERGSAEPFDPASAAHKARLSKSFKVVRGPIVSVAGSPLGTVAIHLSDAQMQAALTRSLLLAVATAAVIALLLIAALLLAIRHFMVAPFTAVADAIRRVDATGLPAQPLPDYNIAELALLTDTINAMVTTIRAGRTELQSQHDRLQSVLEGTNVGTWEWIVPTGETVFNERWANMIGYRLEELAPVSVHTWSSRAHPDDLARSGELLDAHFRGELPYYECETRMRHKDGSWVWVLDRGKLVSRNPDGSPLLMCGTHQDITARKQLQLELEQHRHQLEQLVEQRTAQLEVAREAAEAASRAKSMFLANMSHELRTPLTAILGMNTLALRRASDPKQAEQLKKADIAANHLLAIINDVLDIARIEAERLVLARTPFVLDEMLGPAREFIQPLADKAGLAFHIHCPPELAGQRLLGDALRLRQVLINLAGNAVKFTPAGRIDVRLAGHQEDDGRLRLTVEVEDTGIGIAPADQLRIFNPFEQVDGSHTRAHGGTGLGLTLCRQLVTAMGGAITVRSQAGAGATFSFHVLLDIDHSEGAPRADSAESGALEHLRARFAGRAILVVDDQPVIRELLRTFLENAGLAVAEACDGQEAIAAVTAGNFALVLMDMAMPNLNGVDATRAIRALPAGTRLPIIAVTANAYDEHRQECLQAGMNDFLAKPIRPDVLYQAVLKWLLAGR